MFSGLLAEYLLDYEARHRQVPLAAEAQQRALVRQAGTAPAARRMPVRSLARALGDRLVRAGEGLRGWGGASLASRGRSRAEWHAAMPARHVHVSRVRPRAGVAAAGVRCALSQRRNEAPCHTRPS